MSHGRGRVPGSALELWRPPQAAGDPVGCLSTTYTFDPGLFDEQCLARFLEVGSEPDREDLSFLLERESRLGGVYAGVLVEHAQAGVEHSLRWDVLRTRLPAGKQHAKLSVLAWATHVRVIVASANLTEAGYRFNQEVAVPVDLGRTSGDPQVVEDACGFLEALLPFVPGATSDVPEVLRARDFLRRVRRLTRGWSPARSRAGAAVRQRLVFTLPASTGGRGAARSALGEAIEFCRQRGGSPQDARVASPFFDPEGEANEAAAALCKSMTRGGTRRLDLAVPCVGDAKEKTPRLAAPRSLLRTARRYSTDVTVRLLPQQDDDRNRRPWHAKMLALRGDGYTALMVGSSNFTGAGLGLHGRRNAEANLLTVVERGAYAREPAELEAVWPPMRELADPDSAEWLGPVPELEEEEQAPSPVLPVGFLAAGYRAGDERRLILLLDPAHLPAEWTVSAGGGDGRQVADTAGWVAAGRPGQMAIVWEPVEPPAKLLVRWPEGEAFWPLNVEDARRLPPPAALEKMSADEMLRILAASDPGAASRAWARQHEPPGPFDDGLDSAAPVDLDPLRRYDLHATFLHRIRRRARVLAGLRANLQRPVWGRQALEWRLRGFVGVEPLAMRLLREVLGADGPNGANEAPGTNGASGTNGRADEALLTLADFLIVLRGVKYEAADGSLRRADFEGLYFPFLRGLAEHLDAQVRAGREQASPDVLGFWDRVVQRCRQ
jgi:hypothetical protein